MIEIMNNLPFPKGIVPSRIFHHLALIIIFSTSVPCLAGVRVEARGVQSSFVPIIARCTIKNDNCRPITYYSINSSASPPSAIFTIETFQGEIQKDTFFACTLFPNFFGINAKPFSINPGEEIAFSIVITSVKFKESFRNQLMFYHPIHWSFKPGRYCFSIACRGIDTRNEFFPAFSSKRFTVLISSKKDVRDSMELMRDSDNKLKTFISTYFVDNNQIRCWAETLHDANSIHFLELLSHIPIEYRKIYYSALGSWARKPKNDRITQESVRALLCIIYRAPSPSRIDLLLELVNNESSPQSRRLYYRCISKHDPERSFIGLCKAYDHETSEDLKISIIRHFERYRLEVVRNFLNNKVKNGIGNIPQEAACVLCLLGDGLGAEFVIKQLEKGNLTYRAVRAIVKSNNQRGIKLIEGIKNDGKEKDREKVKKFIREISIFEDN